MTLRTLNVPHWLVPRWIFNVRAPCSRCAALTRDGFCHPAFHRCPLSTRGGGACEMGSSPNPSSEFRDAKFAQQPGSCADMVDAFGRVHVRASEDLHGYGDRGTPTVLTKLKKWAGTIPCLLRHVA